MRIIGLALLFAFHSGAQPPTAREVIAKMEQRTSGPWTGPNSGHLQGRESRHIR